MLSDDLTTGRVRSFILPALVCILTAAVPTVSGCASGRLSAFAGRTIDPASAVVPPTAAATPAADIPTAIRRTEGPAIVSLEPVSRPASSGPSAPSPTIAQHSRPAHPSRPPSSGGAPHTGPRHGGGGLYDPHSPQHGHPIVIPQIYGYPPAAPPYGFIPPEGYAPPPPATLSGQIEVIPSIVPLGPTRSRATYQVVPLDPVPQPGPVVETLPPPSRSGYFELPPPPE